MVTESFSWKEQSGSLSPIFRSVQKSKLKLEEMSYGEQISFDKIEMVLKVNLQVAGQENYLEKKKKLDLQKNLGELLKLIKEI